MKTTELPAKNSSEILPSTRGDARISVAEKWASRRRLRKDQQERSLNQDSAYFPRNSRASSPSGNGFFSIPPLCILLRRTFNGFIQHEQRENPNPNNTLSKTQSAERDTSLRQQRFRSKSPGSPSPPKQENNKRVPFPSVLSILKANAVQLQVETMMMAEENQRSKTHNNGESDDDYGGSDSTINGGGLSILPAKYSDFSISAVNHMAQSRSRAFLLLDFTAIVQTHTVWRKRLAIQRNSKDVQIVYSARHNCNAKLLQLLQRLGIGLRVATKYDLAAVRKANSGNYESRDRAIIWDDSSILVKPNSFYRNLVLDDKRKGSETEGVGKARRVIPMTVADVEEMERIHKQLHGICKRRCLRQSDVPKLEFVLKLDNNTDDFEEWETVLRKMIEKVSELRLTEVVGVALDLERSDKDNSKGACRSNCMTETEKESLVQLLDALSNLIENWENETMMSNNANPDRTVTTPLTSRSPQVHLTNPIVATEIENQTIEWIEKYRQLCSIITIDASRLLMANAAALCTRVIGMKSNDQKNTRKDRDEKARKEIKVENDRETDGNKNADHGNIATKFNYVIGEEQEKDENAIQQHLYIDDGCYGSLSNYPNDSIPLPLKNQRYVRSLSETSRQLLERQQENLVNTTVWGPTCDGLDKVCSNVPLPRLSRDDWLVFTDHGFCNEGTCFNGFSPPDIACCVLGANP